MKIFKHTTKLKDFYSEGPYAYHLDSTTSISLHLLCHVSVYPSTSLSTYFYLDTIQSYFNFLKTI